MKIRWFLRVPAMICVAALVALGVGLIVMLLWNELVPALFNGPVITYWQAVGLLILSKILFHGFGGRHHGHHHRDRKEEMKRRFMQRMDRMTPEQREKFRSRWESKCGPWRFDEDVPQKTTED
jgi:hypothetical protein